MIGASKQNAGFTLIELMVALAILAGLSLLTTQAIRTAIQNRASISADLDRDARLADTLRIIKDDIAKAFHYRDFHVQSYNDAIHDLSGGTSGASGASTSAAAGASPTPAPSASPVSTVSPSPTGSTAAAQPLPSPKPSPVDLTGFVGDKESLYFTALVNVRMTKDTPESDQAKVGYYLKSCHPHGDPKLPESKCLMRVVSPWLDDDVTKVESDHESILVEHVQEFKLRYYGPGHDDPVDAWKTGKNGDEATREVFPYVVEVTLALQDKDNKRDKLVKATILAPLYFPNNAPSPTGSAAPGASPASGAGAAGSGSGAKSGGK